jgi:hypothetical protein
VGRKRVKVGIMQPYFFPYIGYFQLAGHCDAFVLYDDVEYTKRGWITRNRLQDSGVIRTFSLSLRRDDDHKKIRERELAPDFDRHKLVRRIEEPYRRAPYFHEMSELLREAIIKPHVNLYDFLESTIAVVMARLSIKTTILRSSQVPHDLSLRGQDRVVALCAALGASTYVNPIGGTTIYSASEFLSKGIDLTFLRSNLSPYPQGIAKFEPAMSVIDMIAFCGFAQTAINTKNDYVILEADAF